MTFAASGSVAELMESAKASLERIRNAVDNLNFLEKNARADGLTEEEKGLAEQIPDFEKRFDEAMDDDINTADAISVVFELVRFANTNASEKSSGAFVKALKDEIVKLCDILGIIAEQKAEVLDEDVEKLIEERQAARKAKNFARADEIRAQLMDMGIELLDTREGVKWKRV